MGNGRLPLIDRYLLVQMGPPMAAAFAVVLISLLLYRLLEIFNLLAASSAQFELAARLIGGLLPHYLGLALPAGYFISIFMVVVRLGGSSEFDALMASGLSVDRIAAPFLAAGVVVMLASLILLGFLQPYGRYGYNAGLNAALASGWNGRLQPRTFLSFEDRVTIWADEADSTGRRLEGVFVRRVGADGQEQVFTAPEAFLTPSADGERILLTLRAGQAVTDRPASPAAGGFETFILDAPSASATEPFRRRGASAREMTLPELLDRLQEPEEGDTRRRAESELHTRLVRTVSPLLLPFLALPLGVAAKRARRGAGFIVAAVALLLYEYGIDMAQALADMGRAPPATAVWTPFVLFAVLCVALYIPSRKRPGETPIGGLVDWIGGLIEAAGRRFRPPTAARP